MKDPHFHRPFYRTPFIFSCVFIMLILIGTAPAVRSQSTQPDIEAKLVSMPDPDYPSVAKDALVSGNVNVRVNVDEKGQVTNAAVASGPGATCPTVSTPAVTALREAAVATASRATFSPAMAGTSPTPSVTVVAVEFKMEGSPARSRTISGGVLNGKATSLPTPDYPAAAKAVNASGEVGVRVTIAEDGSIYSAEAVSGHPLLRSASVKAACSATFSPTLLQGQPVKVSGIVMYKF